MGVVLHRVADDVGDLREAAVVLLPEGVEDAALHGLEAVLDGGDRAVADDVGGVFAEVEVVEVAEGAAPGEPAARRRRGRNPARRFPARRGRRRGRRFRMVRLRRLVLHGRLPVRRADRRPEQAQIVEEARRFIRVLVVFLAHLVFRILRLKSFVSDRLHALPRPSSSSACRRVCGRRRWRRTVRRACRARRCGRPA